MTSELMNKKVWAICFAILAAGLYAINIPLSKLLLNYVDPTMMASYLYLGAGLGIGVLFLFTKKKTENAMEKMTPKDMPFVVGMVGLDIIAPILLMFGLLDSVSSKAALLNNFEIVCTSLIALFIFKEVISRKMWLAIFLITVSSFILSFEDITAFKFSWGAIFVLLATLCWGLENNCTRKLSNKNTYQVVFLKGIFSGLGAFVVAICLREKFASLQYFALALLLGFVAYGLSIFFYIKAQSVIGAAKTSAYYAITPFIGTFFSFLFFDENPTWGYYVGLGVMILGTAIVVVDTLSKKHNHTHKHVITHIHDGLKRSYMIKHKHEHTHYVSEKEHKHKHRFIDREI